MLKNLTFPAYSSVTVLISTEVTHNSTPTEYGYDQIDDFLQRSMFYGCAKVLKIGSE